MVDQVLDLRGVVRAIGRRRAVLTALLVLGLAGGFLVLVLSPTTYLATSRVVLPPSPLDSRGREVREINTEVQIVRSVQVLTPASKAIQPALSVPALGRRLHVRGISSQIVEIAADAPTAAQAAQLANAVAGAYVAYSDDVSTSEANATAAAYATEANRVQQQVQQLDAQIARETAALSGLAPANAQRQESVIDTLRAEEATIVQQLNVYQTRIADAQLNVRLSREGTQVLQPALLPRHQASPRPLWDLGGGLLAGGLIGGILALALEQADHRLRRREDIADAVGAPVLASLRSVPVADAEACKTLLDEWEPSVVGNLVLRHAFDRLQLEGEKMTNLVVIGLSDDTAAVGAALQVAMFVASRGIATAFILASHEGGKGVDLRVRTSRSGLAVYGPVTGVEEEAMAGMDLIVTFVVSDGGPLILPTWDRCTLVTIAVSSGFADADRLESLGAACLAAGLPVSGVFVANPDPGDATTGQSFVPVAAGRTPGDARRDPVSSQTTTGDATQPSKTTVENSAAAAHPHTPTAGSAENGPA